MPKIYHKWDNGYYLKENKTSLIYEMTLFNSNHIAIIAFPYTYGLNKTIKHCEKIFLTNNI